MNRPGGSPPPATTHGSDGTVIDLESLASEVCVRFYVKFPEELIRSGEPGVEWCRHDNQYLLAWAFQEARDGTVSVVEQALWLAGVLGHRGFPLERLVGNLELASDVMREQRDLGSLAEEAAARLVEAARAVAAGP